MHVIKIIAGEEKDDSTAQVQKYNGFNLVDHNDEEKTTATHES
jgi:hypothetical protein